MELRKILPLKYWNEYNYLLVKFGQNICKPTGVYAWLNKQKYPSPFIRFPYTFPNLIIVAVEIIFKSLPENILPGFTYTGKIYYGDRTDKLLVPLTSVNKDSKGYYVAKIENNSIVKKYIKIGDSNEKFYEVVNGLKEGDEILLINLLDYKNRQNFQLKNPMLRGIGTGTPGTRSNQPGK
jgi:hypothetical protein